jgi:hypothetical protein
LLSGSTNATLTQVDSNDANFSWQPWVTDANTTNSFRLEVADNRSPSMSATQSFIVVVNPFSPPNFSLGTFNNGQLTFQVNGQTGPDYAVDISTNLVDWSTLFITNSPRMPFSWTDTNAAMLPMQFYRIKVGPPLP